MPFSNDFLWADVSSGDGGFVTCCKRDSACAESLSVWVHLHQSWTRSLEVLDVDGENVAHLGPVQETGDHHVFISP